MNGKQNKKKEIIDLSHSSVNDPPAPSSNFIFPYSRIGDGEIREIVATKESNNATNTPAVNSCTLLSKLPKSIPKDVPWGRLVALKDCKAVVRGRQYDLTENEREYTQVGRNSLSHVQFLDLTVSGEHCILRPTIKNGILIRATIEDRSSNGTWLNSKRMSKRVPRELKSGDVISLVQPFRRGAENVAAFVFSAIRNPGPDSCTFFKQYKLGIELGRGTYATVRKCSCRATGKEYAVKIIDLNSGLAQGWEVSELIKNAENEAAMQQDINHPNVIRVYAHFVDKKAGTVYIVMELLDGCELFIQLRRAGRYNETEGRIIMKQILSATTHMNSLGITHRDMKPANILLVKNNGLHVKIADFGVAIRKVSKMCTYTGSPMYFAPEVLRLKHRPKSSKPSYYSCSSDMWSVGVIMFNILCARNPWTAAEFEKTLEKTPFDIEKKDPWPSISESAKDLLRKLWNPDPKTRIEAKEALQHPWIQNAPMPTIKSSTSKRKAPSTSGKSNSAKKQKTSTKISP
jgi:serine/threonine protein kinase